MWTHETRSASTQRKWPNRGSRMGLAFYWCSVVNQWHLQVRCSSWQRESTHRSRRNVSPHSLAWSVTSNTCSLRKSSCGLNKSPWSFLRRKPPNISTQEARASFYHDIISSIEILRDMPQAWESYPTSHHSVKSLHEGLWPFPRKSRGRKHQCLPLPFRSRPLPQTNLEREKTCDPNLTELEQNSLGRVPFCQKYIRS